MTIDNLLTFEDAKELIGPLVRRGVEEGGGWHRWYSDEPDFIAKSAQHELRMEFNSPYYQITWHLIRDSPYVVALERLAFYKNQGINFSDVPVGEDQQLIATNLIMPEIFFLLEAYTSDLNLMREGLNRRVSSSKIQKIFDLVEEAAMNAVEYGSDFCRNGDVSISFFGGEEGVLFSVKDPGLGFPLQSRDLSEGEMLFRSLLLADNEKSPVRGYGIICFQLSDAVVNSKAHEQGHTLLIFDTFR
jgi:anti-sigma regulatory factor (Ser/Thr protein kinase)